MLVTGVGSVILIAMVTLFGRALKLVAGHAVRRLSVVACILHTTCGQHATMRVRRMVDGDYLRACRS